MSDININIANATISATNGVPALVAAAEATVPANADGTYPVLLTTTLGFAQPHNVQPGTTAADLLAAKVPGFDPARFVIKKVYKDATGVQKKEAITADYVVQPGDHVSAVTPKNVAGA